MADSTEGLTLGKMQQPQESQVQAGHQHCLILLRFHKGHPGIVCACNTLMQAYKGTMLVLHKSRPCSCAARSSVFLRFNHHAVSFSHNVKYCQRAGHPLELLNVAHVVSSIQRASPGSCRHWGPEGRRGGCFLEPFQHGCMLRLLPCMTA